MLIQNLGVFSAYAEVFLLATSVIGLFSGFLRVRGGVSIRFTSSTSSRQFSPRTRRCFLEWHSSITKTSVFSAYAEVFLYKTEKFFL